MPPLKLSAKKMNELMSSPETITRQRKDGLYAKLMEDAAFNMGGNMDGQYGSMKFGNNDFNVGARGSNYGGMTMDELFANMALGKNTNASFKYQPNNTDGVPQSYVGGKITHRL